MQALKSFGLLFVVLLLNPIIGVGEEIPPLEESLKKIHMKEARFEEIPAKEAAQQVLAEARKQNPLMGNVKVVFKSRKDENKSIRFELQNTDALSALRQIGLQAGGGMAARQNQIFFCHLFNEAQPLGEKEIAILSALDSTSFDKLDFEGMPAEEAVKKVLSKVRDQFKSLPEIKLEFSPTEDQKFPIWLSLGNQSANSTLWCIAICLGGNFIVEKNTIHFSSDRRSEESLQRERNIVRGAYSKSADKLSNDDLRAAELLLVKARNVTIGGVGFGGEIQEEGYALVILSRTKDAEQRFRKILKMSAPAGQAYAFSGLGHLNRLSNKDMESFLKEQEKIGFSEGGCMFGSIDRKELLDDWIKTNKLFGEIKKAVDEKYQRDWR